MKDHECCSAQVFGKLPGPDATAAQGTTLTLGLSLGLSLRHGAATTPAATHCGVTTRAAKAGEVSEGMVAAVGSSLTSRHCDSPIPP
jgi:hypothetical protein